MVPAGFESHCGKLRFGTLAIPFTPLCQCLSEETLKAVDPLESGVYARGSKRSHQSALECVTIVDSTTLREGQSSVNITLCIILKFECSQYR